MKRRNQVNTHTLIYEQTWKNEEKADGWMDG